MLRFALLAALIAIPEDLPVPANIGGRATSDTRFGWPGVYFEGRVRGSDVYVVVDTGTEHLRVLVDGVERGVLTRPGKARIGFEDLGEGEHVIRLEKMTESQSGSARFAGFFTRSGMPLPVKPRARRIEFIGDSYTVGYGNTSPMRECSSAEVHDTTDTQRAFGPLVAKRLDAEYRVIAYSGYGIVRNYAGNKPGESLPFLYPRAIPGEPAAAPQDDWRPQVIVINLGTNDFSTPVKPGEVWADAAALRADYRTRYVAFVRMLQARQPQARFVLMGEDKFFADVAQVARATGTTPLKFGSLELSGCSWHPSLKDHRTLADLVEKTVAPLF